MTKMRILSTAAAMPFAALCLSACASEPARAPLLNPLSQYSMKVETGVDRIALAPHRDGLTETQRQALKALAGRRAETDGGVVTVSLPRKPADVAAASRAADAAQAELVSAGARVTRSIYESDDPQAPLLVSFDYSKAAIPLCGRWDDLTKTGDNRVYGNFGCAVTANMAAQIAHPADIIRPHAEDPADTARRMTVLGKYEEGKSTAAESPQAAPSIAHIGQ